LIHTTQPQIDLEYGLIDLLAQDEYLGGPAPQGDWKRLQVPSVALRGRHPGKLASSICVLRFDSSGGAPRARLEPGVKYTVYYGTRARSTIDLGVVAARMGQPLFTDAFERREPRWTSACRHYPGRQLISARALTSQELQESDLVAAVDVGVMRMLPSCSFQDTANYCVPSTRPRRGDFLVQRVGGVDQRAVGFAPIPELGPKIRLTAEVRGKQSIVSVTDGRHIYTSQIAGNNMMTEFFSGLRTRSRTVG